MSSIKYPLTIKEGSLELAEEGVVVADAIKSALATARKERVLNPRYGASEPTFNLLASLPRFLQSLNLDLEYSMSEYGKVKLELYGTGNEDGLVDVTVIYETDTVNGSIDYTL